MSTRSADSCLRLAGLVAEGHRGALSVFLHRLDLGLGENLDAAFAESLLQLGGNLFVFQRHHAREHLENRDRRAERMKNRGELHAHGARADNDQRLRHFRKVQNFAVAQDHLAVELNARQRARFRAGGEHDVGGFDFRDFAVGFDRHASRARPAAPALHRLHFIFAEKKFDALGVPVDDAVLAREHRGPIQLEFGHLDAKFLGVLECVVDFRVVQQNLGGDAADVKAGSPEKSVLFDDQSFQAPLRGANRGDVTARPAANDGQIVSWQEQPPRHTAARTESPKNGTSDAAGLPGHVGPTQHNEI